MRILTIEYNPIKGIHTKDGKCQKFVDDMLDKFYKSDNMDKIYISAEILIDFFRIAVIDKKINHECLKFKFKDDIIDIDENGKINYWPDGFGDLNIKLLSKLAKIKE